MKYFYTSVKNICDEISSSLYKPVEKTEKQILSDIISKNNEIKKGEYRGFRHLSNFYTVEYIGNEVYSLPLLDESLFSQFDDYMDFIVDSKKRLLYVSQFIKKLLITSLDSDSNLNELVDLGSVLPQKLLNITKLKYKENSYVENPAFKSEWDKYNPEINKLLAMRIVL
jgi:hypothetical protein